MKLVELFYNPDPALMEMATLHSQETGLNYSIWIGKVGGQHGPRIKVSNIPGKWRENDNFTMNINEKPTIQTPKGSCKISKSELEKVKKWISMNFDDLMLLWYMYERDVLQATDEDTGKIVTMDNVFDSLKKV